MWLLGLYGRGDVLPMTDKLPKRPRQRNRLNNAAEPSFSSAALC
jgi:hypothetical protein